MFAHGGIRGVDIYGQGDVAMMLSLVGREYPITRSERNAIDTKAQNDRLTTRLKLRS